MSQGSFDNLIAAPKRISRRYDAHRRGQRDDRRAVRTTSPTCGLAISGQNLYAKLVVRSIDLATRSMNVVFTVDPNCGFLSFADGVPKN